MCLIYILVMVNENEDLFILVICIFSFMKCLSRILHIGSLSDIGIANICCLNSFHLQFIQSKATPEASGVQENPSRSCGILD